MVLVIVFLLGLLSLPLPVLATTGPTQLSPLDGSSVSSSSLTWQAPSYQLYSTNPYRVQVDDEINFGSLNKDYYTDNTSYSPSLTYDLWYWRVKSKDSTGTWSDWSSVWSFTLSATSPSPSPSPSSSPSTATTNFIISAPSEINSDQSFKSSVTLSLPNYPSTKFYLKGAFKKSDSSNYFGLTKVGGSWIQNGSSFSNQYQITTDSSGNWSGTLDMQPDILDSGYDGSGDYIFKVGRYSESGSGPTWSNEINLKIIAKEIEAEEEVNDLSKIPTKEGEQILGTETEYEDLPEEHYSLEKYRKLASNSAVTTPSPRTEVRSEKQTNPLSIIGTVLIIGGFLATIIIYAVRKFRSE